MTKTNTSYTLMAFGTGESYHMPKKNFLTKFYDACTTEKSYLDGPSLLGIEVKGNAEEGCARIIDWLENSADQEGLTVNLTGFSRGAVTCIHIANRLNRYKKALAAIPYDDRTSDEAIMLAKLEKLQLNLLIVDPVAGYTAKSDEDARVIPENVRNYIAILQLNEGRRDFKPQDNTRIIVEDPKKTRVAMLPLYGHHSASIKDKGNGMDSAAHIVWAALHSFLTSNGSGYAKVPNMVNTHNKDELEVELKSKEALCDDFGRHHAQRENYAAESKKIVVTDSLPTVRVPRKMNQHLEFYVRDSDFFVNKLERELFKITYPKIFNYLFENNAEDPRFPDDSGKVVNRDNLQKELKRMEINSPNVYAYLQKNGKIKIEDGILATLYPQGSRILESLSTVEMIYPEKFDALKINNDKESLNNKLNELEVLTQSIYRVTFQYQREKLAINVFDKRTEDARAERIRNEVLQIVKRGGDVHEIKDKVLTLIYGHAIDLELVGSNSELLDFLNKVLVKNGCGSTSAPENKETLQLIRAGFKLADEAMYFVATGGYVGGAILSVMGILLEDIGNRVIGLTKNTQADMPEAPKPGPREKVLSKIGESLVVMGSALKSHFGLKVLREGARAKISGIRDSFFCRKLVSSKTLVEIENRAAETGNEALQLCVANKEKVLLNVNENSSKKDIEKHNAIEERTAALKGTKFFCQKTKGVPGEVTVVSYTDRSKDEQGHLSAPAA